MREEYLHYLWKMKRIPFHKMKLQDGREFNLISQGIHNENNDGPDFYDAKIEIDGLIWVGPVELHVKSSDWNLHKHQFDSAYNNVILHVVYDDNMEIVQEGRNLPCLELKTIVDSVHHEKFELMRKGLNQDVTCSQSISKLDPIYIYAAIDQALVSRFERKLNEMNQIGITDPNEVLYRLIAQAFGAKVNKLPFEELTTRLPYSMLKKLKPKSKKNALEYVSGLFQASEISEYLNEERKLRELVYLGTGSVNLKSWKFSGVRPQGFPSIRVKQFATFLNFFCIDSISIEMSPMELLSKIDLAICDLNQHQSKVLKISRELSNSIIINAIVPYLMWASRRNGRDDIAQNALELLQLLPTETNSIIRKWKDYGVRSRNAQESQGLIELYNEHCLKKKCLTCTVGTKILNR